METVSPKSYFVLRALTGPTRGNEYVLDGDEVAIDKRFVIINHNRTFLLKSLTFNEVMINGEAFMEAILESGDKIITETSEYIFLSYDPSAIKRKRLALVLAGIAIVIVLALLVIPVLMPSQKVFKPFITAGMAADEAKKIGEQMGISGKVNYEASGTNPFQKQAADEAMHAEDLKVPETQADVDAMVALARLRMRIADTYANETASGLGNIYWAMSQWQMIIDTFRNVQPPPGIVAEAMEHLAKYKKIMQDRKEHYILVATLARARHDNEGELIALQHLVELLQVEGGGDAKIFAQARYRLEQLKAAMTSPKPKTQNPT